MGEASHHSRRRGHSRPHGASPSWQNAVQPSSWQCAACNTAQMTRRGSHFRRPPRHDRQFLEDTVGEVMECIGDYIQTEQDLNEIEDGLWALLGGRIYPAEPLADHGAA